MVVVPSADDTYDEFLPPKGFPVTDFDDAINDAKKRSPRQPNSGAKKQKPLPPWKDGVISAWATNLYDVAGKMLEAFDADYGQALQMIAIPAGAAWEGVAKTSPGLRRIIHQLMQTTKLSELVMAHIPLIIVVMHKHGPMREMFTDVENELIDQMPTNGATSHAVG